VRITKNNGTIVDVPKVRGIASLLALGVCDVCGLAFGDGRSILEHGFEDCSDQDKDKNRGVIRFKVPL